MRVPPTAFLFLVDVSILLGLRRWLCLHCTVVIVSTYMRLVCRQLELPKQSLFEKMGLPAVVDLMPRSFPERVECPHNYEDLEESEDLEGEDLDYLDEGSREEEVEQERGRGRGRDRETRRAMTEQATAPSKESLPTPPSPSFEEGERPCLGKVYSF